MADKSAELPYRVPDEKAFILDGGIKIHGLEELFSAIKNLSDEEFRKHVNTVKNDFANWIRHCFAEDELAEFLEQNPYQELTLKVLDGFITKAREMLSALPKKEQEQVKEEQDEIQEEIKEEVKEEQEQKEAQNSSTNIDDAEAIEKKFNENQQKEKAPRPEQNEADPKLSKEDIKTNKLKRFFNEVSAPAKEKFEYDEKKKADLDYEKDKKNIAAYEKNIEKLDEIPKKPSDAKAYVSESDVKSKVLSEEKIEFYNDKLQKIRDQIGKVYIGQVDVVDRVLMSLICNAHSLLEGVPGLAKTLLIETLGKVVKNTTFHRIQFLPDLLPADIIGGQMFNPATGEFMTMKGPIFANFVLADEINRAPPKTHAALMEAMQEKKISIDRIDYILDKPFL